MKKLVILILSVSFVITLLSGMFFRYKTLSVSDSTKTYIDLWTGNRWSDVKDDLGTNRIAVDLDSKQLSEQAILKELTEMKNKETIVTTVWFSLLAVLLIAIVFVMVKVKNKHNSIEIPSK